MLYREKIEIGGAGGYDENGAYIPPTYVPWRGNVSPLTSEESADRGRDPSSVAYKVAMRPPAVEITSTGTIRWRGVVYQVVGKPQQFVIGGRVHHLEVIIENATG